MSTVAPRFIFTVNVEVGKSHDAEARIWGRCVEGEFGIGFQLEQLRQRGFGGSFFVNVYESRRHGAEFFGKVCRRIVESGSDVELHTHPDGWTEDWSRPYMWQYTLAEQVELVRLGQKMLADWTGSPAIAHRAGSFAANDDTLRACIANGLRIDSSKPSGGVAVACASQPSGGTCRTCSRARCSRYRSPHTKTCGPAHTCSIWTSMLRRLPNCAPSWTGRAASRSRFFASSCTVFHSSSSAMVNGARAAPTLTGFFGCSTR